MKKLSQDQKKIKWNRITYLESEFRETVLKFSKDRNLARLIWRVAKTYNAETLTLAEVTKILIAADETIWILETDHAFSAEDPNTREKTWVGEIDRKQMYGAMKRIENAGWASSELVDIKIGTEERKQRVWTLKGE